MSKREPKIGDVVAFKHAKTRYPEDGYYECPAMISEISERGDTVDLIVLSCRIGVVPRPAIKRGKEIGTWDFLSDS